MPRSVLALLAVLATVLAGMGHPAIAFDAAALPELMARGIHERPPPAGAPDAPPYVLLVPEGTRPGAPLLVVVHGGGRRAGFMVEQLAVLARQHKAVVVSPAFDAESFADYHVFGQQGKGGRSDLGLLAVVDEVAALTGAESGKLLLFGYSGGGQFVHRFAMAYPGRVARFHAASAGWYTWPSGKDAFPYGPRATARVPGLVIDPAAFLAVPGCVTVGSADDQPDANFSSGDHLMPQGANRIDRAARWVAAMSRAAGRLGLDTPYVFTSIAGGDHGLAQNMEKGLGPVIDGCLFGATLAE